MLQWVLLVFAVALNADATQPSDGRAAGLLSDCPGSTKEATISKHTLTQLFMIVMSSNLTLGMRYDYFQIKQLATDPDIDFSKPTMLYLGGYLNSPYFPFNSGMGVEYKKLGYNVIMLDTLVFTVLQYPRTARLLRAVGKHTAQMLSKLTTRGLDPKRTELVGNSIGAHTAGFIAKHYRKLTGESVAKVVALDAAGPCFRNLGPADRLDRSDADFVVNIGTNIDGLGMAAPFAHVNFYVNGGEHQPGPLLWAMCPDVCSHLRAYEVWLSALTHPDHFIGVQCDSVQQARDRACFDRAPRVTNPLGPKTDRRRQGIFYVATTNRHPFFMGEKGLFRENDFFLSVSSALNEEDVLKI